MVLVIGLEILTVIIDYIQLLFQQAIVLQIAKTKHSNKQLLFSGACVTAAFQIISRLMAPYSYFLMVFWIALLIVTYIFIFRQGVLAGVLMGIGQMLLSVCVEYIVHMMLIFTGGDLQSNFYANQMPMRGLFIVIFLLLYLAVREISINLSAATHKKENWILWAIYLLFLILFSMPNLISIERSEHIITNGIEMYNVIIFIAFFSFNIIYMRSRIKIADISHQLEMQRLYSDTLEKSAIDLRDFKHDFVNIITTVGGLADTGSIPELQDYIRGLSAKYLRIGTAGLMNSALKDSPILYGIVLSKTAHAELNGIEFRLFIKGGVQDLGYCDPVDFSRIIGILLDNALEAAEESDEKYIELNIEKNKGVYAITVTNSCKEGISTGSIFERGYTTKKSHSGLGLGHVTATVEKYRKRGYAMSLDTTCAGNVFTQVLTV